jgi:hypothetical protein
MKITCPVLIMIFSCSITNIKAQTDFVNDKDTIEKCISELEAKSIITSSPLLVIDGFPIDYDDYKSNNHHLLKADIKQIDYLSKDSEGAKGIYGERGRNGVLLITTVKSQEALQEKSAKTLAESKILFLLGDREISQEYLKDIDPNDIESIDVIKNKDSIKEYTTEDYEGVVVITLKANKKKKNK